MCEQQGEKLLPKLASNSDLAPMSKQSEQRKCRRKSTWRRKPSELGGLMAMVPKSESKQRNRAAGRQPAAGGREGRGQWSPAAWCQPRAGRGGLPEVPSSGTPSRPLPAGLSWAPWHRAEGAGSSPRSEPLFFFSTPPSSSSSGCYIMSGCSWKPDGSDVTLGKGGGKLEGAEVLLPSPPCH